jgi:hypothetical protein
VHHNLRGATIPDLLKSLDTLLFQFLRVERTRLKIALFAQLTPNKMKRRDAKHHRRLNYFFYGLRTTNPHY